ncbi:Uncharacterised protein [Bordetella pertussis]|nr:Uncharacterised protein [Bordetella pertussis]
MVPICAPQVTPSSLTRSVLTSTIMASISIRVLGTSNCSIRAR